MRRACTTTPGGGLVWNYNSSTAPNAVPQAATATICAETTRTNRYVTVCRVGDEWIEKSESYDDDWLIGVNINDWLSGNASIASNGVVTINMEFGRDDRYEGPQNFVVYERDYSTTVTVHLSAANPLFGARSAGSFSDRDYNALDPKPGFSGRKSLTLRVIAGGGAGGTVDFAFVRALPAGSDVPNQCTGSTPYPYVAP